MVNNVKPGALLRRSTSSLTKTRTVDVLRPETLLANGLAGAGKSTSTSTAAASNATKNTNTNSNKRKPSWPGRARSPRFTRRQKTGPLTEEIMKTNTDTATAPAEKDVTPLTLPLISSVGSNMDQSGANSNSNTNSLSAGNNTSSSTRRLPNAKNSKNSDNSRASVSAAEDLLLSAARKIKQSFAEEDLVPSLTDFNSKSVNYGP